MKILIITTNFPRWTGDFRVPFIFEAARALHKKGHTVRVITMHNPGASEHETMDGIEVLRARYLPEKYEILQKDAAGIPAAWERGLIGKISLIPYFFNFYRVVKKYSKGFDIIHANWSLSGLVAYLTSPFHKTPYIITVQGSDIFKTVDKPLIKPFISLALKNASRIIALSNSLREAVEKFGIPEERISVIPNGIDISQFPMGEIFQRQSQILFVGSLIERKGVNFLVEAFEIVSKRFPKYKLIIIGEGDQRSILVKMTLDLGIKDKVTFLGTQSQSEVASIMRKSKLFILPSVEEGQGVVLVEALASGTPCIGSCVGGITDVITTDVGRVFESKNIHSLSEFMLYYLEDEQLWQKTSLQARQRAENYYDWNILTNSIIDQYKIGIMKE